MVSVNAFLGEGDTHLHVYFLYTLNFMCKPNVTVTQV